MSATIIGLILILVGVLAILFMPSSKGEGVIASSSDQKSTDASNGKSSEDETKAKAEAAAQNRAKQLEAIVAPSSAPPLRIYFGS